MEIEALKVEEIEAKGFVPIVTDNGTYHTYNIGDNAFVAIDSRNKHREIWGYYNGKKMPKDEAEELVSKIFDTKAVVGEADIPKEKDDVITHKEPVTLAEGEKPTVDYYVQLIGEITEKVKAEERITKNEWGYAINMVFHAVTKDMRTALISELKNGNDKGEEYIKKQISDKK